MKKYVYILISGFLAFSGTVVSQTTFPVNGIPDERHTTHAFINAKLWVDYQTRIDSATLVIKDGKIVAAGKGVKIPEGAILHNLNGKSIYPSFVDADTQYGISETFSGEKQKGPQISSSTKGAYDWNQAIKSEQEAYRLFIADDKQAETLRKAGFGTVHTYNHDGIARGSGAVVVLAPLNEQEVMVKDKATVCFSFKKGTSRQDYPTSEMGAIALLRQSFLDAEWYRESGYKQEYNISIEAWNNNKQLIQFFESDTRFQTMRIDKIGKEFGVKFIVKGSGDEYQRLSEIKATGIPIVLPVKFPQALDLSDPYDAENISLEELKHWEMAPANAYLLDSAGVVIAFTSNGLKDPGDFMDQLKKIVSFGLSPRAALKACTFTPASLLGVSDKIGSLKTGMLANFIITSGDIFNKESSILENWVLGNQFVIRKTPDADIRGTYRLTLNNSSQLYLKIGGPLHELKSRISRGTDTTNATVAFDNNIFSLKFDIAKEPGKGSYVLSGFSSGDSIRTFSGSGIDPSGKEITWNAIQLNKEYLTVTADTVKPEKPTWGNLFFPNKAYGFIKLPGTENVLFRNVTVWTNEADGILQNADVLISDGKISKVGKNLSDAGVTVIDGTGKHLTPGVIDEHSHIAVSGDVNECSHAVTSEVRIGDVIDCDDINVYRQLSGGVTTAQLLHGSCNPIGGQSAIIKLRWGVSPEKMKFENAPGFIKFALGENVKQSNFGDDFRIRFPQTRMGVEQVYVNAFQRAKEYEASWKQVSEKGKSAVKPRRDLRLETLVEILNGKRFITCHSYQQGEINMLMHVADSMGFKINTFTHILEGYKVADKMKARNIGGSSFSDWWAYKFEVMEAIPYNGAIMHDVGLVVAYNSDDPEMARRLNQEAAKAVKYGGVSEEEALKFVTLNPAKLLHIDNRVGSIKPGKDADVVLWNDHPLSIYASVEMTFVDGIRYYDKNRDVQLRNEIAKERSRIIGKMIIEKSKSKPGDLKKPVFQQELIKHCLDDE